MRTFKTFALTCTYLFFVYSIYKSFLQLKTAQGDVLSDLAQTISKYTCTRSALTHTQDLPVKDGGGDSLSSAHSRSNLSLIQGKSFSNDWIKWWKAREPRVGRISSSFSVFFLLDDSDWISSKWSSVKISSWYKYCMIMSSTKSSSDRKSRWDRSSFLCFESIFEPDDRVKPRLLAWLNYEELNITAAGKTPVNSSLT